MGSLRRTFAGSSGQEWAFVNVTRFCIACRSSSSYRQFGIHSSP
jgi:hypothetical protein